MPDAVGYDPEKQELRFGDGRIGQVPVEVADYSVGDMNIIRKWFEYRLEKPRHAGPSSAPDVTRSPLDTERASEWEPRFADDLVDLLHVIGTLVRLEPALGALLAAISEAQLITVQDLETHGVLPVPPQSRRAPGVSAPSGLIVPGND